MEKTAVGILLFDGVEVLDFAGPYEVFSRTRLIPGVESRRSEDSAPYRVFTVTTGPAPVTATGGLRILPDFATGGAPPIDLLLIPGGFGTRPLLEDSGVLGWIREAAATARRVTSVCTGALLLARAGLLANRRATTHSAGIDMALAVVEAMHGRAVADETARYMDYRRADR